MRFLSFPLVLVLWAFAPWRYQAVTNTYMVAISLAFASLVKTTAELTCAEGHVEDPTTGTCRAMEGNDEDFFDDDDDFDDDDEDDEDEVP